MLSYMVKKWYYRQSFRSVAELHPSAFGKNVLSSVYDVMVFYIKHFTCVVLDTKTKGTSAANVWIITNIFIEFT